MLDRVQDALEASGGDVLREVTSEDFSYEDRQKRSLISGGVELAIEGHEFARSQPNIRLARERIGTAGDRIAIERNVLTGGPDGSPFEVELIHLTEVDAAGKLRAWINFDPDDRRAAFREAYARWFAIDPVKTSAVKLGFELREAHNDRDRARMRACVAGDLVVHDHTLAGIGVLEGSDAYLESIAALWELAPDIQNEVASYLAVEPYGSVAVVRSFGTLSEGGPFERHRAIVLIAAGGRIARMEYFDIEQADAALARFAELCADRE